MRPTLLRPLAALLLAASPFACTSTAPRPGQAPPSTYSMLATARALPAYARQGDDRPVPPEAGHPWPASTASLPAQLWLEVGIARYLAGRPDAAHEAFLTAARQDPDCAMC